MQGLYGLRYKAPIMAMSSTKSRTGLPVGALIDDTNLYLFPAREPVVFRMRAKPINTRPNYRREALDIFKQLTAR